MGQSFFRLGLQISIADLSSSASSFSALPRPVVFMSSVVLRWLKSAESPFRGSILGVGR
jgi:hypothetical protein